MGTDAEARKGETSTSYEALHKHIDANSHKGDREALRLLNACIRGAGAGLCLRGGLHLLSWVFALFSRSRRNRLTLDPLGSIFEQILDTIRYTIFLGSLSGVYVGVDEGIANAYGRQRYVRKAADFVKGCSKDRKINRGLAERTAV